ncbi:MAG: glycoside hydrolase family 2 TIM barrel-domain containing protein [Candidatus Sulfotelmatobacter sp.]
MSTRRKFLAGSVSVVAGALASSTSPRAQTKIESSVSETASLCGEWFFRTDPDDLGAQQKWYDTYALSKDEDGRAVSVPHTWQVEDPLTGYRGVAWYCRHFDAPLTWQRCAVRVEFEAVFHTATVWVNGFPAGEHARRGYTAFTLDIAHLMRWGQPNTIAVRVDNAFNQNMLPRGQSSDWAIDGGIFRPVHLLVTPKTFVERVDVDAVPDFKSGDGNLAIVAHIRNTDVKTWKGKGSFRVVDEETGLTVLADSQGSASSVNPNETQSLAFQTILPKPKLWHFDHPSLYRLEFLISNERDVHEYRTIFGVRKLEVVGGVFRLNGKAVRLMGAERMAGSNPEFGMAESAERIKSDHADMKHLNCVFTRVHWPQDKRVLDYCDRHGILMQSEVPAWGEETFSRMGAEPDAEIMQNGLEQLREMIARDRNHPSVVVWGLCNEIGGQTPSAYQFAKRMREEAKSLDPSRLCSYASDSLRSTPQLDVAGLMDFIETNEYYGTWYPGTAVDVARHLDEIHAAFPDKPIVVSEYGYCACAADRPEGDEHRIEIMRSHDIAIRTKEFVGGAIFFCYNDYRTHVGDRGIGGLQQRVHGVVDLFGGHKPSYELLRRECSPIESIEVENQLNKFNLLIKVRRDLPMYTLKGYKVRGSFFGQGNIPIERREVNLPDAAPGSETKLEMVFGQSEVALYVQFDVLRPTSFSAYSLVWKP